MDISLWPAAAFGFAFVFLGVLRLARTVDELVWGAGLAFGVSAFVVLVSPVVLIPVGLFVVATAWWRTDSAFTKERPPSRMGHIWSPPRHESDGGPGLVDRFLEGWAQGSRQAHERGLVPWSGTVTTPTQEAEGLIDRAGRRNPFRPEGASGLRTGIRLDTHTLATATDTVVPPATPEMDTPAAPNPPPDGTPLAHATPNQGDVP